MRELIPGLGGKKTRKRLDEVFSRQMLGSILVGVAAGKIIEKVLNLWFNTTASLLIGWTLAFVVFVALFVYWEEVESRAKDAAESAKEKADENTS